jgi:hypothetical protein
METWQNIFHHACVDNGSTGISLSSISRYIRRVSSTFRLQSIAITGLCQLQSFLHVLENTQEANRHIRFLFIADDMSDIEQLTLDEQGAMNDSNRLIQRRQRLLFSKHQAARQAPGPEGWYAAYCGLISFVAPFVEVFSLHVPYGTQVAAFPDNTVLPMLRDLSYGCVKIPHHLPPMPLLQCLRVHGSISHGDMFSCLALLPKLERIRLSGHGESAKLVGVLSRYLACTDLNQGHEPKTFGDLRAIIIEPIKPGPSKCGTGLMQWHCALEDLHRFAREHPPGTDRPSITVLSPRSGGYGLEIAAKHWLEVVDRGGDGPWDAEAFTWTTTLTTTSRSS